MRIWRKLKGKLFEDQNKNYEKNIQKLTDTHIENLEDLIWKEKEIIK